jgi:hypothetical protein
MRRYSGWRSFTVACQLVLLSVVLLDRSLSVSAELMMYFVDLILVTACFRTILKEGNWFLDLGFVVLFLYSAYYPLTVYAVRLGGFGDLAQDFLQLQMGYSLLFIATFSLAYVATLDRGRIILLERRTGLFARHYSNALLVPLIIAPSFIQIVILWATVGPHFQYLQAYTASFALKASGLNIINQILNVVTALSGAALVVFFFKEVARERYRHCVVVLIGFLVVSAYIGARSIFLAPLITFIVVYGRYEPIRITARRVLLLVLTVAFYVVVGSTRNSATQGPAFDVFSFFGEQFLVLTNGLQFFGRARSAFARPEMNTYLNDFLRVIPNYVHSTGMDVSQWYMKTFFRRAYEGGSGRAFGFNTEAMINFGRMSIVFQSLALGLLFGALGRAKVRTKTRREYLEVLKILLVVYAYFVVRVTTFSLTPLITSTLVAFLIIRFSNAILSAASAPVPDTLPSGTRA